ncbi:MAG: PorV/PorQ family protein [Endomicrobiales bacterium]|nr:PorV/PorQ family protein [Endomicrobiales bacterium]
MRKIFIFFCLLVLPVEIFAAGTTGADFLKIGPAARPCGMAGAFVAVSDETSGMFWNPAGLGFMVSPELQTTYILWPGDLYYSYLAYSHPTKQGIYALGLQYLSGSKIEKFVNGASFGSLNYYDGAANVLFSRRLRETLSAGVNLKYIKSHLDSSDESALTGDVGLLYRTFEESFSFGLSGKNLFGKIGKDDLPQEFKTGIAYKSDLPQHYSDILFSIEVAQPKDSPVYYAAGIEHWGGRTLGLRIGYKYIPDDKQRSSMDNLSPWSAGLSIRVQSCAIDYSYQPMAALGNAHRITLNWRVFGWKTKMRVISTKIKAEPVIFSPNGDGAKDSVFFIPQVTEIKNVSDWKLQIKSLDNIIIKELSGKDLLPKILTWEGQTEDDGQVVEGKYHYQFVVEGDSRKRAESGTGEITADLTVPSVSLVISTETFSPNDDGFQDSTTFYVSVSDIYGIDQWKLSIINSQNKNVRVFVSTSSEPVEIVWDGKDDYYGAVVPEGEYKVQLQVWDVAGNKEVVESQLKVQVPVKIKEIIKEVKVAEDDRGLVINLSSNILYERGKYEVQEKAYKALNEVVNLLNSYPKNNVLIEGHTDSIGSKSNNRTISSKRAWGVYSYLVKHGVAPARLKVKGWGEEKPIAANSTSEGRAKNRRVDIIILKSTQ